MKKTILKSVIMTFTFLFLTTGGASAYTIDHNHTDVNEIPDQWLNQAKQNLVIMYDHASHGYQLTNGGMDALEDFDSTRFSWEDTGAGGENSLVLSLDDNSTNAADLGDTNWEPYTRTYLNNNPNVNVVMWLWCGQLDDWTATQLQEDYLDLMNQLELDYPNVTFVYTTGHLNYWQQENVTNRNNEIRTYATTNNKILYDFADIENWDPDGNFYEDGSADLADYSNYTNWGQIWYDNNPTHQLSQITDLVNECQHSDDPHGANLNCAMKGSAAWWLWARIAGWDGNVADVCNNNLVCEAGETHENCPNDCADTSAPSRSAGSPSGSLDSDTTSTDISLNTNETATCRYSTIANTSYSFMTSSLITTNDINHSANITGLENNTTYTYYVRCEDDSNNQNDTDYVITFTVSSEPAPVSDFSVNDATITIGESVNFTDSSTNAVAWSWDFEGGTPTTSNDQNPNVTYDRIGTFQVSLTVQNNAGAIDNETKTGYIRVTDGSEPSGSIEVQISQSSDDAEENEWGYVALDTNELEMAENGSSMQTAGLRFQSLNIPQGANITNAYIQFTGPLWSPNSSSTSLILQTEQTDNSTTFLAEDYNITNRLSGSTQVSWNNIPTWNAGSESGQNEQTPDLSSIIQEIVNRENWLEDNTISFLITGTGTREAISYDNNPVEAPVLIVEYASTASEIRADVNQDGTINTTDAQLTLRNSLGLNMSPTAWQASDTTGDVNCDGTTNTADAQLILRYSLGLSMDGTEWCE